ncbi:unnamed protein product [Citrullus colocynthis]|uniref:Transmembrane protein n=1 Tax=Citrullus colocynthis TaxID=252529 RepID=A0ABP0ZB21_9ROSI
MKKLQVFFFCIIIASSLFLSFFFFSYFLSPLVSSKHRNIVLQLVEIIWVVKSSRALVFLASNAIVFILFSEKFKRLSSKGEGIEELVEGCKDCSRHSNEMNSSDEICIDDSFEEDCEEGLQDDIEKKAQEFIDLMNAFWREELICDRFL